MCLALLTVVTIVFLRLETKIVVSFIDDVVNAVNDYTFDGVNYIASKLRSERGVARDLALQKDIEDGSARVLQQLQKVLDVNFDKLELYVLQHILKIPDHLRVS